jgi:hypothetical protein
MEERFDILKVFDAFEFATPALMKFGDRLDSKLIAAKKKTL